MENLGAKCEVGEFQHDFTVDLLNGILPIDVEPFHDVRHSAYIE